MEETPDNTRLVNSYKEMGYINFIMGDGDKAVEYFNSALSFSSMSEEIYSIKLMLVEVLNDRANYDEALSIIEKIEHKIRETSNVYGKMLLLKCMIFYFKRDKEMLAIAQTSEEILLNAKDYENLAQTENLIGLYYFAQGDTSNALYYFNKAYELCEKINDIKLISSISSNLGMLYHMSGRISISFEFFHKALDASKRISNIRTLISSSINLGISYLEKGCFNKSEDLLKSTLEKAMQVRHIYLQCTALMNIGEIEYKRGIFEAALQCFNEAMDLSVKHEMKAEEGINYINISKVLIKQSKIVKAEEFLMKGFIILNDIKETSGLIDYYICKSKIEIMNRNQKSIEFCELASRCLEELEDDFKKIIVLRLLGNIYFSTDQYERALELYSSSIRLSEQLETEYQIAKGYYYRAKIYK